MREFHNIAEFIVHMTEMIAEVPLEIHHGLKKCAVAVEKTAKDEIGHYQEEIGPFAAWDKLEPETLAYHERMGVGDSPLIVTGGLYASISHEVEGLKAVIGSDSDVMVYQELGTHSIPPRAVLGPAALRNKELIEHELGKAVADGILYGSGTISTALE